MRISDWSSDVCSSDLNALEARAAARRRRPVHRGEGREGGHLSIGRANEPLAEILGAGAIGGVALDIDALDAALVDEVVDVAAAPRGPERVVNAALVASISGQPLHTRVDLERLQIVQVGHAHPGKLG